MGFFKKFFEIFKRKKHDDGVMTYDMWLQNKMNQLKMDKMKEKKFEEFNSTERLHHSDGENTAAFNA